MPPGTKITPPTPNPPDENASAGNPVSPPSRENLCFGKQKRHQIIVNATHPTYYSPGWSSSCTAESQRRRGRGTEALKVACPLFHRGKRTKRTRSTRKSPHVVANISRPQKAPDWQKRNTELLLHMRAVTVVSSWIDAVCTISTNFSHIRQGGGKGEGASAGASLRACYTR